MAGRPTPRSSELKTLGLAVSTGFVALALAVVVLYALVLRACSAQNDWRFSARVEEVRVDAVCLSLVGGGPGYVENDCLLRADIVGLPSDIRPDECVLLNQELHSDLVYEGRESC
jgi:hypothetical protein